MEPLDTFLNCARARSSSLARRLAPRSEITALALNTQYSPPGQFLSSNPSEGLLRIPDCDPPPNYLLQIIPIANCEFPCLLIANPDYIFQSLISQMRQLIACGADLEIQDEVLPMDPDANPWGDQTPAGSVM